jgi:hypothetical protein
MSGGHSRPYQSIQVELEFVEKAHFAAKNFVAALLRFLGLPNFSEFSVD